MQNKTDFFIGLAILIFCTVMFQQISLIPDSQGIDVITPKTFPFGITCALSIFSLLFIISAFKKNNKQNVWPEKYILKHIFYMALAIIGYVGIFIYLEDISIQNDWPVGIVFSGTTFFFLCISQIITGYKKLFQITAISFGCTLFFYIIFVHFFKVPLP